MELPYKLLEQKDFNTRPKIEEHMSIVMDKSIQKQQFSQPLQTKNKQFEIAVTFLTGYNGFFNVSVSNNEFFFTKSINEDDFSDILIPPGAYELESLNDEIKRIFIRDCYFTEGNYLFIIQPYFSTLGSIIQIKPISIGIQITFTPDDSIRGLLAFDSVVINGKYNLSQNPVDGFSFDNIFLECKFAQGMSFKGKVE